MWQSRIEIEYYSIAYFERITEFDVLARKFWSGVKIGPGGPKLAAKIGPPLPKMVRMRVLRSRLL